MRLRVQDLRVTPKYLEFGGLYLQILGTYHYIVGHRGYRYDPIQGEYEYIYI